MQCADVLHCVTRPTEVCRGSAVYHCIQAAICIWHSQGLLPCLYAFLIFVGNPSSFEVIHAPHHLLTTSDKCKVPPCNKEIKFHWKKAALPTLRVLFAICVCWKHISQPVLFHCKGPGTALPLSSFGTRRIDLWGTTAVQLPSSGGASAVNIQHLTVCASQRGGAGGGQPNMISKLCLLNFKV